MGGGGATLTQGHQAWDATCGWCDDILTDQEKVACRRMTQLPGFHGTGPSLDLIVVLLAEGINFVTVVNNSLGDLKEVLKRVLLSKMKFTMPTETEQTALEPEKMQAIQLRFTDKAAPFLVPIKIPRLAQNYRSLEQVLSHHRTACPVSPRG